MLADEDWLETEKQKHALRSVIDGASGYVLGQWEALTLFLNDVRLPIDNNVSERALRVAALRRA